MANLTRDGFEMQQKFRKEKRRRLKNKAGMLTGGQAKIAAKAPPTNKIDAKDFAVLRAEKAGGRGRGLQDEKIKPGKVTKAALGVLAAGLGAKKRMEKKKMAPVAMGAIGASMAKLEAMKKVLGRKMGGKVMGARRGTIIKPKGPGVIRPKPLDRGNKPFRPKPIKPRIEKKMGGGMMMPRPMMAKSGKMMDDMEENMGKQKTNQKLPENFYQKPQRPTKTPRLKRPTMMGGGMMKRPMMANKGKMAKKGKALVIMIGVKPKKKMGGGLMEATQRLKAQGKMGGGMMMRPNPVGMKSGKSVKVKCKIGRNKPTKMY